MVKDMMEQPLQNETPSWNCQDWVMETSIALQGSGLPCDASYEKALLGELEHMLG